MEFKLYDFRDALAVLRDRPDWDELVSEIRGITRSEVLKVQAEYRASGKRVPAGAQKAVNEVFDDVWFVGAGKVRFLCFRLVAAIMHGGNSTLGNRAVLEENVGSD